MAHLPGDVLQRPNCCWNGSSQNYSNPQIMTRQMSTTTLIGPLSSIRSTQHNSVMSSMIIGSALDFSYRSFNRKVKHGSKKKKKNKRKGPPVAGEQPKQRKLSLKERLALEEEQARQRHLYRKSQKMLGVKTSGQGRTSRKEQAKIRLHDGAKYRRILATCDHWFSAPNLRKDDFLRNTLKRYHGYVPIQILLTFPKFHFWTDGQLLVHAFKSCPDRYKVRFEPNLWRPPFPPGYVRPHIDRTMDTEDGMTDSHETVPQDTEDGLADNIETVPQGVINGSSVHAPSAGMVNVDEEDDENSEDDWEDSEVDRDAEDHDDDDHEEDSDDEEYSDDENRLGDDEDSNDDSDVEDNDNEDDDYDDDDFYSERPPRQEERDSENEDEDGFGDDDVGGWADSLDDTNMQNENRMQKKSQDYYDPGLSDESESETKMRRRNRMWSNDNTYHVYNAFVRHRLVNLEFIEKLEQEKWRKKEK